MTGNGTGLGERLTVEVVGVWVEPYAAVPTIVLRLRITERGGPGDPGDLDGGPAAPDPVHALALRCQIRIEPQRRSYDGGEQERLYELFGDPPGWGDALRPFPWTHVSTMVGAFTGAVEVDLPIECTYDLEIAGTKYLDALGTEGEVPLLLLFSGTLFRRGRGGAAFAATPVAWDSTASYRLPVAVWRSMIDRYYPDSGWLRLPRTTLRALQRYKAARALPTWEQTVELLLEEAGQEVEEEPT